MKESEFVELLNLYIDHEITGEDAARLEAEVASSPERKRTYQQYCRMQKACSVLAERYRETVPESDRAEVREPARGGWPSGFYGAGLLAAACLTVLAVVRLHPPGGVKTDLAQVASGPAAIAMAPVSAPVEVRAAAAPVYRDQLQPVVDLHDLALTGDNAGADALLTANQNAMFAWMAAVQMAPVQRTTLNRQIFTAPAALRNPDSNPMRRYSNPQAPVEMAAFRFQR